MNKAFTLRAFIKILLGRLCVMTRRDFDLMP
jgi:hypothetical protein